MNRYCKYYSIILVLLISGCGSTYQFIPPHKLAAGEHEVSVVVAYDFNRLRAFPNIPVLPSIQLNAYWGIGKDYVAGFDYLPPAGIGFGSIIKYFNSNKADDYYLYFSWNRILARSFAPTFELGATYAKNNNKSEIPLTLGLWSCFNDENTFFVPGNLYGLKLRPHPFIRLGLFNDKFKISAQNYIGLKKKHTRYIRSILKGQPEIKVNSSDINNVFKTANRLHGDTMIIIDSNPFKYALTPYYPYFRDFAAPVMGAAIIMVFDFFDEHDRFYLINSGLKPKGYKAYFLVHYPVERHGQIQGYYELNDAMISSELGRDIYLTHIPSNDASVLNPIKWYRNDWSIAIGFRTERER